MSLTVIRHANFKLPGFSVTLKELIAAYLMISAKVRTEFINDVTGKTIKCMVKKCCMHANAIFE
jgi:hypothetical protein